MSDPERSRKFFSGRSLEQAVVAAANYHGINPGEVKYREIEKRHGFVRTRRNVVIAVEPDDPRKAPEERRPEAPAATAKPGREGAPPESAPRRREVRGAAEAEPEERGRRRRPPRTERAPEPPAAPEERAERPRREKRSAGPWWEAAPVAEAEEVEEPEAAAPEEAAEPEPEEERRPREEGERGGGERYRFVEREEGLKVRRDRASGGGVETGEGRRATGERPERRPRRGERPEGGRGRGRGGRRDRGRAEPAREAPAMPPASPPAPRAGRLPRVEGELAEAAQEALDHLLEFVGVEAEADLFRNEERLEVELWGPDDHVLLEEDGEVLLAIEHLLPRMLRGIYGDAMPVRVDCNDFHFEREERLRALALRTADEVRRRGRPRTLAELDPAERRIVHITLADDADVATESIGDGFYKRLKVLPK